MSETSFPRPYQSPSYTTKNVSFTGNNTSRTQAAYTTLTLSANTNVSSVSVTDSFSISTSTHHISKFTVNISPPSGYSLCGISSFVSEGSFVPSKNIAKGIAYVIYPKTSSSYSTVHCTVSISGNNLILTPSSTINISTKDGFLTEVHLGTVTCRYIKN